MIPSDKPQRMMKDFTTTSFGFIIAYLLPGFFALYAASSWSESLKRIIGTMLTGQSDAALALAVGAFALIVGLVLNSIRWLVFEKILCRQYRVAPSVLANLKDDARVKAFLMVIEETFRYHQFYGSMFVILPMLSLALLRHFNITFSKQLGFVLLTLIVIALQVLLGAAWYQKNTRAAATKWLPDLLKKASPWLFVPMPVLYLLSLLVLGHFDQPGNFRVSILFLMLLFGELIVGANAVAALKRYCDRIHHLSGN